MRNLTATEIAAINAFRNAFPAKRLKAVRIRSWESALYCAWLEDWPEQRGELRALRNSPDFDSVAHILMAYNNPQWFERQ